MSHSSLLEVIAAAMLDGTTLTFSPADPEGTALPTGMVVGARLDRQGRIYHNTAEVDFGGLSLATAADRMLARILDQTIAPVIHAALDDDEAQADQARDETADVSLDDLLLPGEHAADLSLRDEHAADVGLPGDHAADRQLTDEHAPA